MAQKLEVIRGGGGSVKLGTTGTISSLISQELESSKSAPQAPSTSQSVSTSTRSLADEASSSSEGSTSRNRKDPRNPIPGAYDKSLDGAPRRKGPVKKGHGLVEIVDIKCGTPNKLWANPIKHHLKKLSFSKLSDSNS